MNYIDITDKDGNKIKCSLLATYNYLDNDYIIYEYNNEYYIAKYNENKLDTNLSSKELSYANAIFESLKEIK